MIILFWNFRQEENKTLISQKQLFLITEINSRFHSKPKAGRNGMKKKVFQ